MHILTFPTSEEPAGSDGEEGVLPDRKFEEILHTKEMERALKDGGRILAELAWQLASHPETMEKIKKDHALYRSGN